MCVCLSYFVYTCPLGEGSPASGDFSANSTYALTDWTVKAIATNTPVI